MLSRLVIICAFALQIPSAFAMPGSLYTCSSLVGYEVIVEQNQAGSEDVDSILVSLKDPSGKEVPFEVWVKKGTVESSLAEGVSLTSSVMKHTRLELTTDGIRGHFSLYEGKFDPTNELLDCHVD
jgi:hypothetical protein